MTVVKKRLGVLISGNGSNLQSILDASEDPNYPAAVALVISNNSEAHGLVRAKGRAMAIVVSHRDYPDREAFDQALMQKLDDAEVDFVILAGFMRILSPAFVNHYKDRLINIHPSLLPEFPGTHAIEKAFAARIEKTGVTVHFVDEGVDTGRVIRQDAVSILPDDSLESLEKKIHEVEHKIYPEVIRDLALGKVETT